MFSNYLAPSYSLEPLKIPHLLQRWMKSKITNLTDSYIGSFITWNKNLFSKINAKPLNPIDLKFGNPQITYPFLIISSGFPNPGVSYLGSLIHKISERATIAQFSTFHMKPTPIEIRHITIPSGRHWTTLGFYGIGRNKNTVRPRIPLRSRHLSIQRHSMP